MEKKRNNVRKKDYRMVSREQFYSIWKIVVLLCLVALTGCKVHNTSNEASDTKVDIQRKTLSTEEQITTEAIPETSIAAKNWEIMKYPVEGTDNLYELPLKELCEEDSWIIEVKRFENQFLVLMETQKNQAGTISETMLYLVDPLTTEITANATLPSGLYFSDGIHIKEKEIEIFNIDTMELLTYDERLQRVADVSFGDVGTDNIVVSENQEYAYYMDNLEGCLYQLEIEQGQKIKLFEGMDGSPYAFGHVIGLLNQDTCLVFSYYLPDLEETIYEVRELATGNVLYQDSAELGGIECEGEEYLLRHYEDGLSEILFGNNKETSPRVFTLKDYKEYDSVMVDLQSSSVISGKVTENAKDDYYLTVAQNQQKDLEEDERVTKLSLNQYSLQNGKCQYGIDLYSVLGEQDYLWGCKAVYVEDAECIVCYVDGSDKRWLVWDLTKESSKTGDETDYIYQWQNPEQPDQAALAELRTQAEHLGATYGVDIYLGGDINNCPKDIYEYKVSNNIIRIEKMLNVLEKALEKYPEGMLAQLGTNEYEGSRLQIYLAGGITPTDETGINSIGIQNTIDGVTFLVLDINSFGDLENTIYHEIFHAIENHLNWDETAYFDYEVWNSLNPGGFEYDFDYKVNEENVNYDYTVNDMEHECYFADIYCKSFPNEDRARIIEFAMLDDGDERKSRIKEAGIQAKLKYICEQIRKGFDTTGWPEKTSWEEALNE